MWQTVYEDTDKLIERDSDPAGVDERGRAVHAERTTYRRAHIAAAVAAVEANQAFLDLATPTAAQNAAQVKALTRQVNALIRRMAE